MKNLSLFVSAFALCASTSFAAPAINCSTLPDCGDLGYKDLVTDCPNQNKVLICPFDVKFGKCIHDAKVGDLKYSLNTKNHDGWYLCNGQPLSKTIHKALYDLIGTQFNTSDTTADQFRIPNYRGFFLRGYIDEDTAKTQNFWTPYTGNPNTSMYKPQKEQLPNASFSQWIGWTGAYGNGYPDGSNDQSDGTGGWRNFPRQSQSVTVSFTLSNSNSIYTNNGHVIPANYAANIFIYAGK